MKKRRKSKPKAPRTIEGFFTMAAPAQDRYERALHGLSLMRNKGLSRAAAAREAGMTTQSMQKAIGSALEKSGNRYHAKPSDRLLRVLVLPTKLGAKEIGVRSSRQASLVAKYDEAVRRFMYTGDSSRLRKFEGKGIGPGANRIEFLTDLDELERLANQGLLSFESIYARAA